MQSDRRPALRVYIGCILWHIYIWSCLLAPLFLTDINELRRCCWVGFFDFYLFFGGRMRLCLLCARWFLYLLLFCTHYDTVLHINIWALVEVKCSAEKRHFHCHLNVLVSVCVCVPYLCEVFFRLHCPCDVDIQVNLLVSEEMPCLKPSFTKKKIKTVLSWDFMLSFKINHYFVRMHYACLFQIHIFPQILTFAYFIL